MAKEIPRSYRSVDNCISPHSNTSQSNTIESSSSVIVKPKIAAPSSGFAQDGYHGPIQDMLTQPAITETSKETNEYFPHTTVIIPIHNDPKRVESLKIALEGIRQNQSDQSPVKIVIADNGLNHAGVEEIKMTAIKKGLDLIFVDAAPLTDAEKGPAHARNVALKRVVSEAKENTEYRGPILLIDSDGSPLPGTIQNLRRTLLERPHAVAATANIISVDRLDEKTHKLESERLLGQKMSVVALPSLWTPQGKVDLGSIVAFSSSVAGKTNGSMLSFSTASKLLEHAGRLYIQMPNKSAEDMIAATAFSKSGVIYLNSGAKVLDEARETFQQTQEQQIRWGTDHFLLAECLRNAGLLETDGIHVLEPVDKQWLEWVIPGTTGIGGYVVNPREIGETFLKLTNRILTGQGLPAMDLKEISLGQQIVGYILDRIEKNRDFATTTLRTDLPQLSAPEPSNPRYTDETKIARLIGNIIGLGQVYDLEEIAKNKVMPNAIILGTRQSASWN